LLGHIIQKPLSADRHSNLTQPKSRTLQGKAAVLADFDWSRFDQIAGVMEVNPTARGVLFDLPQVCLPADPMHCC